MVQLAAILSQQPQTAGVGIIGDPDTQPVAMFFQHLQQQLGLLGIIFSATAVESFAVFGQILGIDRIQQQEVDIHQAPYSRLPRDCSKARATGRPAKRWRNCPIQACRLSGF